jgi:hypothetical protein
MGAFAGGGKRSIPEDTIIPKFSNNQNYNLK